MNIFHVPANLVDRLGWALVHSAWQLALVALAALLLMRATRRCSAASRYAMLLLVLAAMVVSPAVTLIVMPVDESMALATVDEQAQASDARQGIAEAGAETDVARSRTRESSDGSLTASATTRVGASESPIKNTPADSWRSAVDRAVRPWLSVIVAMWCLGVLTFAWRPLLSWHTVRRLRRVGVSPVLATVVAMLRQTSERLRLRQTVQILQSTLTRVPVVIGYLRPVILLPVSVIAGVPTSQLEAILAHELAHVRRHDFLVNLLQTLVETLFFYHPAVWWLSHRIRLERENCCDDLAVSALGNRVEYGRALLAIEELRGTSTALALGIRSGSLLDRVQRLFDRDPAERSVGAVGIVGIGLLAIVIVAVGVWNSTLADKPHAPADEQAARMTADEQAAWDALDALNIPVNGEAANRWTLKNEIKNMERATFPVNAIRKLREQLERPVRAADFWNVPAEAWTHIGRLTSLQELRVVGSDLRGKPMDEIGRLTNLRKLIVTNSKCNSQDLAPLHGLADLEHLEVMCTVFEESGAWRKEQLGELTAEEQAVVARCVAVGPNRESMAEAATLTDRVLASLGGLHRLRTLRLWNTYVSGRGLESLKTLPAIEELDLTLIEFTPETARIVGGLRTLKRFRYADVTDESLTELAGLSELEDLHVWARGVTDRGVDHLLKLAKLKKLAILGSQLSDAGLQRLASLPHLESLDLSFSGPPTTSGVKPIQEPLTAAGVKRFQEQRPECKVTFEPKSRGAEPAENVTDVTQPVPADEAVAQPPRDTTLDVVAQIRDAEYTRPTAKDQEATAMIPAEAWGEPVNGLRVAIVLRSPPIDKDERLCYDIVAENVSDHDIRTSAEVGNDTWHFFFKAKLTDADGKQVEQQRGIQTRLGQKLDRFWLKPRERNVISSWATKLLNLDDEGKPLARLAQDRGPSSFRVKPGRYSLSAAMDLGPIVHSVDPVSEKRTVLSPVKGEWSGKLQTGAVPVALFTEPAPADEAAEPTRVTFVIAQHVILHDGKIVTWEEVDKILDEAAKAGKIYRQFYLTNGGMPREEELREHSSQLYKKLYDAGKIKGMGVGSLSPRSGEYLDRIKTPADLVPDESTKQAGRVLDVGGQPLADVEVFPLPAEHVNGVYLRDGRNRNPLEERITRSDRDGKVMIFPEPGDTLIAAVHPNGFAITTLAEFKEQMGRLQLQPWARVTGQRPAEGDDAKQSVDFTCYPVPGLSFHIYETEIAEDGRFDQKFVPPGKVIVSRSLSTGQGGSLSFPVETIDLLPGQSHKVPLGPIPDDAKAAIKDAEARRKQAEPKPKPADQSTDTTQRVPAEESVAKRLIVPAPPIESRQAVAAARQALLRADRDKHKHLPLEFRIAASKDNREADGVAWFPINIMGQRKAIPVGESGANLPIQEQFDDKWRGLLWDKAEHALLADGTWRVVKCDVAQSAQSTDLAPSFEIRITLDAAGGASLRRLTSAHLNQPLAIVADGAIISTAVIIEPFSADFVITGIFSKAAAEKLADAIRKPYPRKVTVFYLRSAQAESAVATLKAEAARRKLRGFEATIDVRLNCIAITAADPDTLKALKKILDQLETPVGGTKPESSALSKLAGVWIAEKVTSSDEVVPKEKFPFELHFEKDKLIYRFVPPSSGKDRVHEIVVDETKAPATIDITREIRGEKETVYAIYKLEGDRLWIHSFRDGNGQPSEKRPTTFDSSKEERSDMLVLTRKPASP